MLQLCSPKSFKDVVSDIVLAAGSSDMVSFAQFCRDAIRVTGQQWVNDAARCEWGQPGIR